MFTLSFTSIPSSKPLSATLCSVSNDQSHASTLCSLLLYIYSLKQTTFLLHCLMCTMTQFLTIHCLLYIYPFKQITFMLLYLMCPMIEANHLVFNSTLSNRPPLCYTILCAQSSKPTILYSLFPLNILFQTNHLSATFYSVSTRLVFGANHHSTSISSAHDLRNHQQFSHSFL